METLLSGLENDYLLNKVCSVFLEFERTKKVYTEAKSGLAKEVCEICVQKDPNVMEQFEDKKLENDHRVDPAPPLKKDMENDESEISDKEILIKKLHKKLVLIIHPDKSNKYPELMPELTQAFKTNYLIKMLVLAKHVQLDVSELCSKYSELIEEDLEHLTSQIATMKNTKPWQWKHTDSDRERAEVIKVFVRSVDEMVRNAFKKSE